MNAITACIFAEYLKIRKSKIFFISLLFFACLPCMLGLIMFVQKNPEMAGKLGMIGQKATMLRLGEASWINFGNLVLQTNAAISFIGFGFVTSWIFGRESTDKTLKDILALPVSRTNIVHAKFLTVFVWCSLLSVCFGISTFIIGQILDLKGLTDFSIRYYSLKLIYTAWLTLFLSPPVAFFASYSRGFLLPIGFVILTLILSNFTGIIGLGPWFPWAIPGIFSMPERNQELTLNAASFLLLITTCITGYVGTIAWWKYADHK
jgi:ABC-2 type transport system permease protein